MFVLWYIMKVPAVDIIIEKQIVAEVTFLCNFVIVEPNYFRCQIRRKML